MGSIVLRVFLGLVCALFLYASTTTSGSHRLVAVGLAIVSGALIGLSFLSHTHSWKAYWERNFFLLEILFASLLVTALLSTTVRALVSGVASFDGRKRIFHMVAVRSEDPVSYWMLLYLYVSLGVFVSLWLVDNLRKLPKWWSDDA